MVPYSPNKNFLYYLAMAAKTSIYDSYIVSKNPACIFVRTFNTHTSFYTLDSILNDLHILWHINTIYGSNLILIWTIYGSYTAHTWFLNVSYMVHTLFFYDFYNECLTSPNEKGAQTVSTQTSFNQTLDLF